MYLFLHNELWKTFFFNRGDINISNKGGLQTRELGALKEKSDSAGKLHLWAGAAAAAGSAPSPAGGPAVVSSDSSFPISNSPFRYFASSSFSTSGLSRLFLMSILRFNFEGGGKGVPFFSCKKENLGKKCLKNAALILIPRLNLCFGFKYQKLVLVVD